MSRYFFDYDDGQQAFHDDEGTETATAQEGRDEAVVYLCELMHARTWGEEHRELTSTVRDETGHPVFRATLSLVTERLNGSRSG